MDIEEFKNRIIDLPKDEREWLPLSWQANPAFLAGSQVLYLDPWVDFQGPGLAQGLNLHYSQLFYSKAKLPAIFGNALNFYSSKVGDNLSL